MNGVTLDKPLHNQESSGGQYVQITASPNLWWSLEWN